MNDVRLTGELICANQEEQTLVATLLPQHIRLTRAEPGCLSFEVTPSSNPLVWLVSERFDSESAFRFHQERVAGSEWGQQTAHITRRYTVEGLGR
jgi:quinol monooxygenase YgiN